MRMKWITVSIFCVWLCVFYMLFGKAYEKFNIAKGSWTVLTIVITILLIAGNFFEERYLKKKEKPEAEHEALEHASVEPGNKKIA